MSKQQTSEGARHGRAWQFRVRLPQPPAPPRNPPRAAIFCRVAPGDDPAGLAEQEARCRAAAAEEGLLVDDALVFREVHEGRTLAGRPLLTALRKAVRAREIDYVVCAVELPRLARDLALNERLVDERTRHHVGWVPALRSGPLPRGFYRDADGNIAIRTVKED